MTCFKSQTFQLGSPFSFITNVWGWLSCSAMGENYSLCATRQPLYPFGYHKLTVQMPFLPPSDHSAHLHIARIHSQIHSLPSTSVMQPRWLRHAGDRTDICSSVFSINKEHSVPINKATWWEQTRTQPEQKQNFNVNYLPLQQPYWNNSPYSWEIFILESLHFRQWLCWNRVWRSEDLRFIPCIPR